jgi:hypothetical protein
MASWELEALDWNLLSLIGCRVLFLSFSRCLTLKEGEYYPPQNKHGKINNYWPCKG